MNRINNVDPLTNMHVIKWLEKDNYLIENNNSGSGICAIYCSSHSLWWPETESAFIEQIELKNSFEWYRRRVNRAEKHIFLRDIRKQFYVEGISSNISSIDEIITMIKKETDGYETIVIGSSAGAYLATILGGVLNSSLVINFSGQFSLNEDYAYGSKKLLIKHENQTYYSKWYSICDGNYLPRNMVYVFPYESQEDIIQFNLIKKTSLFCIGVKSKIHGVPIYRNCINDFINLDYETIKQKYKCENYSKLKFARICSGNFSAFKGLILDVAINILKKVKDLVE